WKKLVAARSPDGADDPVLGAMLRRRRQDFLPADQRRRARLNEPLPIGFGQTNSQPTTVADMLWLLDVQPGHRVLDVGSGSGWTTAILGDLVTSSGSVLGVEIREELATGARHALQAQDLGWCDIRVAAPGVLGAPEQAPFDRILVSAEAQVLPESLVDQLGPGGVMVITVASRLLRVVRYEDDDVRVTQHGLYRFVDLIV